MMEYSQIDNVWSAAMVRKMARLADREMSAGQIAKTLGLTRGQVLGKMRRLGLKFKNPPNRPLNRDANATTGRPTVAGRRNPHATRAGSRPGQQPSQRRGHVQTEAPPSKPPTTWPAARTKRMTELVSQGLSHGGIAKALGLTRGQVLGKMRRLGLKTKNALIST